MPSERQAQMRAEREAGSEGSRADRGRAPGQKAKELKKAVSVTPEMEGWQKRAAARMKELQVPPLQVRICFKRWRPAGLYLLF